MAATLIDDLLAGPQTSAKPKAESLVDDLLSPAPAQRLRPSAPAETLVDDLLTKPVEPSPVIGPQYTPPNLMRPPPSPADTPQAGRPAPNAAQGVPPPSIAPVETEQQQAPVSPLRRAARRVGRELSFVGPVGAFLGPRIVSAATGKPLPVGLPELAPGETVAQRALELPGAAVSKIFGPAKVPPEGEQRTAWTLGRQRVRADQDAYRWRQPPTEGTDPDAATVQQFSDAFTRRKENQRLLRAAQQKRGPAGTLIQEAAATLGPTADTMALNLIPVVGPALAFSYWQRQGYGSFIGESLDRYQLDARNLSAAEVNEIDSAAKAFSTLYAAIEFGQQAIPGAPGAKLHAKLAAKIPGLGNSILYRQGLRVLNEAGEEGFQKWAQELFDTRMAGIVGARLSADQLREAPTVESAVLAGLSDFARSIPTIALAFGVPGAIMETGQRRLSQQQARKAAEELRERGLRVADTKEIAGQPIPEQATAQANMATALEDELVARGVPADEAGTFADGAAIEYAEDAAGVTPEDVGALADGMAEQYRQENPAPDVQTSQPPAAPVTPAAPAMPPGPKTPVLANRLRQRMAGLREGRPLLNTPPVAPVRGVAGPRATLPQEGGFLRRGVSMRPAAAATVAAPQRAAAPAPAAPVLSPRPAKGEPPKPVTAKITTPVTKPAGEAKLRKGATATLRGSRKAPAADSYSAEPGPIPGPATTGTRADFMEAQREWKAQQKRGEITTKELGRRVAAFKVVGDAEASKPGSAPTEEAKSVADVLRRYREGEQGLDTVGDVADAVEALEDAPQQASEAVARYRAARQEDRTQFGERGDIEAYEREFLEALSAPAVSPAPQAPPAPEAVRERGQPGEKAPESTGGATSAKAPELMTPEEWAGTREAAQLVGKSTARVGDAVANAHRKAIADAVSKKLPVSAAAADEYNTQFPPGYVLSADRYVFKPPPSAPAQGETPAPEAGKTPAAGRRGGETGERTGGKAKGEKKPAPTPAEAAPAGKEPPPAPAPTPAPAMTVAAALHAGLPVKPPRGATFIRTKDARNRSSVVAIADADTLKGSGPYTSVEFGVKGKAGFTPVEGEGEVLPPKAATPTAPAPKSKLAKLKKKAVSKEAQHAGRTGAQVGEAGQPPGDEGKAEAEARADVGAGKGRLRVWDDEAGGVASQEGEGVEGATGADALKIETPAEWLQTPVEYVRTMKAVRERNGQRTTASDERALRISHEQAMRAAVVRGENIPNAVRLAYRGKDWMPRPDAGTVPSAIPVSSKLAALKAKGTKTVAQPAATEAKTVAQSEDVVKAAERKTGFPIRRKDGKWREGIVVGFTANGKPYKKAPGAKIVQIIDGETAQIQYTPPGKTGAVTETMPLSRLSESKQAIRLRERGAMLAQLPSAERQRVTKESKAFDDLLMVTEPFTDIDDVNKIEGQGFERQKAIARSQHLAGARQAAARELGEPDADMTDPRERARLLPKLREYVDRKGAEGRETEIRDTLAEIKERGDTINVPGEDLQDEDLVYKDGEWYQVDVDANGVRRLEDGVVIEKDRFDPVDIAGHLQPGDTGYDEALAQYRKQERKAEAQKPAATKPRQADLIPESEVEFGLVGQKQAVPEPPPPPPPSAADRIQTEMFDIDRIVKKVDPGKSADEAERIYGDSQKALVGLTRQLDRIKAAPRDYKIDKAQKQRLGEVIALLEKRTSKQRQAAAVTGETPAAEGEGDAGKLEDFGEKLGGARKDRVASVERDITDNDIGNMTFSEIWPKSEVDAIEDPDMAALATALRNEVPAKPRKGYKVARWVESVKLVRTLMKFANENGYDATMKRMVEFSQTLEGFANKVNLLRQLPREHWDRIGKVYDQPDAYNYEQVDGKPTGRKIPAPRALAEVDGRYVHAKNLADLVDSVTERLGVASEASTMQFEVRGKRDLSEMQINKKGDPLYRPLKKFTGKDAVAQARAFMRDNRADLVAAWEAIKESDNVKETDVRRVENRPRTGKDHRQGRDATPQMFMDAFGFRGVEFGNWVAQGENTKERQGLLNQAYDALLDLADIIGVRPKAMSLNGTLGLGLGSRGHGWASAHYEPDTIVINLTKTRGAGSLAHEWFHALDHYFQRQRPGQSRVAHGGNMITFQPEGYYQDSETSHRLSASRFNEIKERGGFKNIDNWKRIAGVRPEVEEAFVELVKALDSSPMRKRSALIDKGKSGGYWSRVIERAARAFENYIIAKMQQKGYANDYLANVVKVDEFRRDVGRFPYLLDEELAPVENAFDDLFGTIKTRETEKGVAMFSTGEKGLPALGVTREAFDAVLADETRAVPFAGEGVTATRYEDADAFVKAAVERGEGQAGRGKRDVQGFPPGDTYEVLTQDIPNPLTEGSKFWLTSDGRWVSTKGNEHGRSLGEMERNGIQNDDLLRVNHFSDIDGNVVGFQGSPTTEQWRELRDVAIWNRAKLMDDAGEVFYDPRRPDDARFHRSRNGQVRAVTIGQRSYFFLDRYDNESQLRGDIREEAGHRLINELGGAEWQNIGKLTYGGQWTNISDEIRRNYGVEPGSPEFNHELVAKAFRDGQQNAPLWRRFLDAVVAAFRRMMRRLGYRFGNLPVDRMRAKAQKLQQLGLTDAEVRNFINRMLEAKARGLGRAGRAGEVAGEMVPAFSRTPATPESPDVTAFRTRKIDQLKANLRAKRERAGLKPDVPPRKTIEGVAEQYRTTGVEQQKVAGRVVIGKMREKAKEKKEKVADIMAQMRTRIQHERRLAAGASQAQQVAAQQIRPMVSRLMRKPITKLAAISKPKTERDIAAALQTATVSVAEADMEITRKALIGDVKKLLAKAAPDTSGRLPHGHLSPEVQRHLEEIRGVVKLPTAAVLEEVDNLDAQMAGIVLSPTLTDEEKTDAVERLYDRRVLLATFGDLDNADVQRATDAVEVVETLTVKGKLIFSVLKNDRKQRRERNIKAVVQAITGGRGLLGQAEQTAERRELDPWWKKAGQRLRSGMLLQDLHYGFDKIARKERKAVKQSTLNEIYGRMAAEAETERKEVSLRWTKIVHDAMLRIFGHQDTALGRHALAVTLRDMEAPVRDTGIFIAIPAEQPTGLNAESPYLAQVLDDYGEQDTVVGRESVRRQLAKKERKGEALTDEERDVLTVPEIPAERSTVALAVSPAEAASLWVRSQDPYQTEAFKRHGYDEEAMRQVEAFMDRSPHFREWALWIRDEFLPATHGEVNDVFRPLTMMNLPRTDNYFPATWERLRSGQVEDLTPEGEFNITQASVVPSLAMRRVGPGGPPRIVSINSQLAQYMADAEHFIAWAEPIHEMRSVLLSRAVKQAVNQEFDGRVVDWLRDQVDTFAVGDMDKRMTLDFMDALASTFAPAVINKPTAFPKQAFSFISYMQEIPPESYIKNLVVAMLNPREAFRTVWSSAAVRERVKTGYSRESRAMLHRGVVSRLTGARGLRGVIKAYSSVFVRSGDALSVFMGYPVYLHSYAASIKRGLSEPAARRRAMTDFEMAFNATQQSGDLSHLSAIQKRGFMRVFNMFKSFEMAQFRSEAAGLRTLLFRRQGVRNALMRILLAHMVMPLLYQMIVNGFRWRRKRDDEKDDIIQGLPNENLRAITLGPLNGIFLVGDVARIVMGGITGERRWGDRLENVLSSWLSKLSNVVSDTRKLVADNDETAMLHLLDSAASFMAVTPHTPLSGLPYDGARDIVTGVMATEDGSTDYPWRRSLGWTAYQMGEEKSQSGNGGTRLRRPKAPKNPTPRGRMGPRAPQP